MKKNSKIINIDGTEYLRIPLKTKILTPDDEFADKNAGNDEKRR